jgi:hypothetical protein
MGREGGGEEFAAKGAEEAHRGNGEEEEGEFAEIEERSLHCEPA